MWELAAGHSAGKDLTFSLCRTQRRGFNHALLYAILYGEEGRNR